MPLRLFSNQCVPMAFPIHAAAGFRHWGKRYGLALTAAALSAAIATAAGTDAAAGASGHNAAARTAELKIETLASGLERPWSMAFLPDGMLLVTERPGRLLKIYPDGKSAPVAIPGLSPVDAREHGGLLDVVADPAFAANRRLYFSYTQADATAPTPGNTVVVARGRLNDAATRVESLEILFRQTPPGASLENVGGRLAVSDDGYLFILLGDRRSDEERIQALNLASAHGKTLRIRTDGTVPPDNPFTGQSGALPEIWTLGHRNPQGAFVHPDTGALWIAEHGPQGGDEINIARKGRNYGWPEVSYGCEYDTCAPIGDGTGARPGVEPPLVHWGLPSIAPSSLLLYTGGEFPEWRGSVFVGGLASTAVWRLALSEGSDPPRVIRQEALLAELGERIRDVEQGPDGRLYLLTDGEQARIVRVGR